MSIGGCALVLVSRGRVRPLVQTRWHLRVSHRQYLLVCLGYPFCGLAWSSPLFGLLRSSLRPKLRDVIAGFKREGGGGGDARGHVRAGVRGRSHPRCAAKSSVAGGVTAPGARVERNRLKLGRPPSYCCTNLRGRAVAVRWGVRSCLLGDFSRLSKLVKLIVAVLAWIIRACVNVPSLVYGHVGCRATTGTHTWLEIQTRR